MQVIEKVKVVPEGYNGAGMNYDGCNRRDVNGKANAGLTLGIIGTALGAWALFGNRRSAGASILGGAGGGMLGDGSTNINVLRKITLTILIFTNILVMLMMISVKSYLI